MKMRSNRPYLFRAFYEWITDNNCTPYVVVDAYYPGVIIPQDYVTDGQIVLNIAPRAVSDYEMSSESLTFTTRFGGVPTNLFIPIMAILGVYAQENGQGMVFEAESPDDRPPPPPRPTVVKPALDKSRSTSSESKIKPILRIIK